MTARTGVYLELPIDHIDAGTNVRQQIDTQLKASIEEVGILQPITVAPLEDDRYVCLYGHRRLAAAIAARLAVIPAVVVRLPEDLSLRQLVENGQRRPVNPIDIALTIRAYLDANPGTRQSDVARKLGKSAYWISQKLLLLDMDPDLQRQVREGRLRDDLAVKAHRASTIHAGRRSRPRTFRPGAIAGTSQVVVELEGPAGATGAQATIELDRNRATIELLLEDTEGYGVQVITTLSSAQLLGKRLIQAYEAAQARPAA